MNHAVIIAFMGDRRIYINVEREVAIERWMIDTGEDINEADIEEITFDDMIEIMG